MEPEGNLKVRLEGRAKFCDDRGEEKTPSLLREAVYRIELLESLVEAAYREGVSHGESRASAYEWGTKEHGCSWEQSEAKGCLEAEVLNR